jgi:hypothetical protein
MEMTGRLQMTVASLLRAKRGDAASANGAGPDAMTAAFQAFRRRSPTFESTTVLDDLRMWEYRRLDDGDHVYLDYTGGGVYAESQLRAHM